MIGLVIALIVVGAALYLLQDAPLDPFLKKLIYVIVVVVVLIYAIRVLLPAAGLH
jgi:hypothetical protein